MRARDAWDRAAYCAARSEETADEDTRIFLLKLRDSWVRVANHCEFFEDAEGNPVKAPQPHL